MPALASERGAPMPSLAVRGASLEPGSLGLHLDLPLIGCVP